jgi:copper chaperone CopZ
MYAAAILVLVFAGFVAAKDEPAKVERITYRLTGLFSSDREKDLREGLKVLEDIKLIAVNYEDAEVTLEFAPNKLFPGQKPERVTELVDEKVRSVTRHTFGIKPRRTLPRDKLQKVTIQVGGLDCKACALAAYEALAQDDGVMQATVNFKEGKATALFDPTKTDKAKLEEALKRKGVDVPGAKK